ncbi:rotatin isoform X2 [Prorops nasuta]|uniref:rotatin isoform X2 n=1 Tax=Prorops nasuta TaxID=863751 RepID=UPI0034D02182
MSNNNAITSVHVKKLGHSIDEIRIRALDNIVSKFDLGFGCDCDAVKKELIFKLFNWFSFDEIPCPEKALDLLYRLVKISSDNYVTAFGKLRFQNELRELRRKLNSEWYEKINEIEGLILSPPEQTIISEENNKKITASKFDRWKEHHENYRYENYNTSFGNCTNLPPLDSTIPFDLTHQCESGTTVSKINTGGIRWLVLPWQPLVASDIGVLSSVEGALSNFVDTNLILHTCQFITNVMLQDFPAEVFLQRPMIIMVLHAILESSEKTEVSNAKSVVSTVLKTLRKLTRSLRFRIYYYCDPCMANKKQKLLAQHLDNNAYLSSETRDSPDGGLIEANYQPFQSAGTSEHSQSIKEKIDDSVLQLQQMLLPNYCIDSLKLVISQLSIPINTSFPLKINKYITDLTYELVQLLISSIKPNIWLCNDAVALKIQENMASLLMLFGEVIIYFENYKSLDHFRITHLHLLMALVKLISFSVPLELADTVLPKILREAICRSLIDAPIYLMYPALHTTLQTYARTFQSTDETSSVQLFDEVRVVIKSMKAAVSILKRTCDQSPINFLKTINASKISLPYHKNFNVIKKTIKFLQSLNKLSLEKEDQSTATKLILSLLANGDLDIQKTMYIECHNLVKNILGVDYNRERLSWENLVFLFDSSVLMEIMSYGATNENEEIKALSEDILIYILKGRLQMGELGWSRAIEAILPTSPILQCHANSQTTLGQCVTKMLDPDVYANIQLPYIEVLKGNLRLLFSPENDIRKEAVCRLVFLLDEEKDSMFKLPKLSSLHGLPLSSLCIFEHQKSFKKAEGNYQRSNLLSVLELLKEQNVDPKIRKSALVQISVMMSDTSLHKTFINENGLSYILNVFDSALVEKHHTDYPDAAVPILTILKLLASSETSVRLELSNNSGALSNIIRSIFLFPSNECVKVDGSQLLCLILYHEYIMRTGDKKSEYSLHLNISLPYIIVTSMNLPFVCKSHWKTSMHRRSDISHLASNQAVLTFVRQFWAWEWNGGLDILWKELEELNTSEINEKLKIQEADLKALRFSFPFFCCQLQLYNIQNSTTHDGVSCAVDYLTMYLKLYSILQYAEDCNIISLPWEQTFERFLLAHPTNREDCALFVTVINFLQLYISITKDGRNSWICRIMKNMTKSLADLFQDREMNNQDIHQAILKLARTCSAMEYKKKVCEESKGTWIFLVDLLISKLFYGDHQHFYNLAYLDWVLTCLTYLIYKCEWSNHKNLLISLGNALIELILSFHGAGTVSFMALSITRNSIICLNHLLHQMQINLSKSALVLFWYDEGRSLSWLPMMWQNREPLIRASALQLLAGLTSTSHTATQLLNAMALAPSEICNFLLQCITNRDESCIVKEQACIAFSNLVRNSSIMSFQYVDSLKSNAILIYVEQSNTYYEISVLCSNIYTLPTLDMDFPSNENQSEKDSQTTLSDSRSFVPKTISYLYNCHDELHPFSVKDSDTTDLDNYVQLIATPTLITAACNLLNSLINIGHQDVIRHIYEHSIDKYLLGCINEIPKYADNKKYLDHYCDTLEMYASICAVLTNCVTYSNEFTSVVAFSTDSIYSLFSLLNAELYNTGTSQLLYLRNRLWSEIYNFIAVLSLTDNQHFEEIQTALDICRPETVLTSICIAIKDSSTELRMSSIGCLAFLLLQEIQKETLGKTSVSLGTVLDTRNLTGSIDRGENMREVLSNVNKLSLKTASIHSKRSIDSDDTGKSMEYPKRSCREQYTIGAELCDILLYLFIAHNYTRSKKNRQHKEDKDLIVGALTNLLCVSQEAKKLAMEENLPETALMILHQLYIKLNIQPYELLKNMSDRDKKAHPLLNDINGIFILLMNFMYGNSQVKDMLTKRGLADILHKLWVWIALNKTVSTSALKLLATFTNKCSVASQSLVLTTTLPGTGLRKTPNTVALIHVIIQLICKEIDKAGKTFDNHKLHFAFLILRNAVHVHECRVSISKSNLLQFFTKIHPITTKRAKPWPLVEIYCLEFLIDYTFYEEGQIAVPKASDALDVLIHLSKCSSLSTKILSMSILRNLSFNLANRSRLLSSVDFINLLHDIFKIGSACEVKIGGSMLWSLVSNNQKGKLIARSAGFSQSIQEALGRLSLLSIADAEQENDLVKMLQYVIYIICPIETKDSPK